MFDLTAKQRPERFPVCFFSLIRLSIFFAWSIAFLFSFRKMFKSFVFGVAIFFEKDRTLSMAFSFPFLICSIFCFKVIFSMILFRLLLSCFLRMGRLRV